MIYRIAHISDRTGRAKGDRYTRERLLRKVYINPLYLVKDYPLIGVYQTDKNGNIYMDDGVLHLFKTSLVVSYKYTPLGLVVETENSIYIFEEEEEKEEAYAL